MKEDTKIVHAGRHPEENFGIVNPPVYHASTVLFPTLEAMRNVRSARVAYGRYGTPGTEAFAEAMAELEGGDKCLLMPSGLAAITSALISFLKAGDHLLMVDTTYEPCRAFCDEVLVRYGIETTYYDPLIGGDITKLMRPNTRIVYTESPGSLTFEVQDIPAISQAAKNHAGTEQDVIIMMDNTWASPILFKPFDHGVDVSIQAVTKYVGGHADVMLGTITCKNEHWPPLQRARALWGVSVGPDDVYLAQRGLRTLAVRLKQHEANALRVAAWLQNRPEVRRVIYPALPGDPGHDLWKRDFTGACGLFGFVLEEGNEGQIAAMLDHMRFFGMGFSWGGFESLLIHVRAQGARTATEWNPGGTYFRIHVGLEDPEDLIADLEAGFARYREAK